MKNFVDGIDFLDGEWVFVPRRGLHCGPHLGTKFVAQDLLCPFLDDSSQLITPEGGTELKWLLHNDTVAPPALFV